MSSYWLADPNCSVQVIIEMKELSSILSRMLNELPDIYRNLITLIDIHGFDYSRAADALEIPVGTVKSRLSRARTKMRQKLGNDFDIAENFQLHDFNLGL